MTKKNKYKFLDFKTTELKLEAISNVIKKMEPLDGKIKIMLFLCGIFVLPYFIAIFFVLRQKRTWGATKIEQAWKYLHMGFGITILLFIFTYLLRSNGVDVF
jgi:hypothetical protein